MSGQYVNVKTQDELDQLPADAVAVDCDDRRRVVIDEEGVVMQDDPKPSFEVTYRRADGNPIHDEYGWVTDLDGFDYDDEPVELVEERWERVAVRTFWHFPGALYACTADMECGEAAVAWERRDGEWKQVCETHRSGESAAGETTETRGS